MGVRNPAHAVPPDAIHRRVRRATGARHWEPDRPQRRIRFHHRPDARRRPPESHGPDAPPYGDAGATRADGEISKGSGGYPGDRQRGEGSGWKLVWLQCTPAMREDGWRSRWKFTMTTSRNSKRRAPQRCRSQRIKATSNTRGLGSGTPLTDPARP